MAEDFNQSMGTFSNVLLNELIDQTEMQHIQDLFAEANGVASIITNPDGTPITQPSNFSNLCTRIRMTAKGRERCMKSNEKLGRPQYGEPFLLPCLNCGLWHAGASITIGDQHVATWIIGQVRIKGQDELSLANRAHEMGINKEEFLRELKQVPLLSFEQFSKVSKLLYAFARQISDKANSRYQLKMATVAREMMDPKQKGQASKDSNSITEATLESIFQGILVVNDQGAVIKSNTKFAEIWGIPEQLLAEGEVQKLMDRIIGQLVEPEQFMAKVKELNSQPEAESLDTIYLKDGRIIHRISGPFYLQGQLKGRVWSFLDVTEHQKEENTIHHEHLVLRTLVDNLPDSIYCKDLACRKTLVNQVELKYIKAHSEAEVLGKDDFDFYPPEIAKQFYADDQMVMQTGIPVLNREEYIIDENGQKRWLLTSKLPLRDKDNQIVGLIGIGRDITNRKLAETEIKNKNEQLILAHAEKDKFFSIIAHDLRNPFSSFLALTKIMDEQFGDLSMEEIHELTHSLKNSAANLYSLLENLLQWARMKQGLIPFNATMISLRPMVEESLAIIREPAKIKGIDLVNHIEEGLIVFSDSNSLQTVIRNLVSNAVKFTPKGGKISLTAMKGKDRTIEISIKDTGIGMSQSMVDNLFRSDARINRPGTEGEPSTGLGLLLCKEFIEKQGGAIWAVSEEGQGSEFHFTVPAEEPA